MGVAEEPAVVTGSQVPSAGCRTLPSGKDQEASSVSARSTLSNESRMLSAESSSTTTGSGVSSSSEWVQPDRTPTVAMAAIELAAAPLRKERRVGLGSRMT